ncbi:MAG TPA: cellulase family glycosylhydrolase [Candidatus Saccharimonadales bacterium]
MAIKGVNLGGWLLLEKWMTPKIFEGTDAIDEWTFMQTRGATKKLEAHRDTFITENDFIWLKTHGIDAVRIPVGYWVLEGDCVYKSALKHLDNAMKWAKKHKLKVLIDLHGAPGSQNGHHHSGQTGRSDWHKSRKYRNQTVDILVDLVKRYRDNPYFWGIELLNEPKYGFMGLKLMWFYRKAYFAIKKVAPSGLHIVFHDAFMPYLLSGVFGRFTKLPVVMDVHFYQFTDWFRRWRSFNGYFKLLRRREKRLGLYSLMQPVIIGEWSVVISGEILKTKGVLSEAEAFKLHGKLQQEAYENTLGWFYWTYKTEGRGIWNFRSLVEDGVVTLIN